MNLEEFNTYFTTNYESLRVLSLTIAKDPYKSVDILHKAYESISNLLKRKDLDDENILGYISKTIKNWSRHTGTKATQFNDDITYCGDIWTNEDLHQIEEEPDLQINLYTFKRAVDNYLLSKYSLPDASLYKLKYAYAYTYDKIVSYTKYNRATAHEIITRIHLDIKEKFKNYKI